MNLTPLLNASPAIHFHMIGIITALIATLLIFARARRSAQHRIFGWVWVVGMALAAGSSFFIPSIEQGGGFSPIHIISIYVFCGIVAGIRAIRKHRNIRAHRNAMVGMTIGGLGIAGILSFLPGRIMTAVILGF